MTDDSIPKMCLGCGYQTFNATDERRHFLRGHGDFGPPTIYMDKWGQVPEFRAFNKDFAIMWEETGFDKSLRYYSDSENCAMSTMHPCFPDNFTAKRFNHDHTAYMKFLDHLPASIANNKLKDPAYIRVNW